MTPPNEHTTAREGGRASETIEGSRTYHAESIDPIQCSNASGARASSARLLSSAASVALAQMAAAAAACSGARARSAWCYLRQPMPPWQPLPRQPWRSTPQRFVPAKAGDETQPVAARWRMKTQRYELARSCQRQSCSCDVPPLPSSDDCTVASIHRAERACRTSLWRTCSRRP